ncbi:MAG: hypothetical protein AAFV45_04750 [Pseudomonadota bacterium]
MADKKLPSFAKPIAPQTICSRDASAPAFTIATLVTDTAQYAEMCASFADGGFTPDTCEYLVIDNTPNLIDTARSDSAVSGSTPGQTCAYEGLNAALTAARAPYVILCHQDVRLGEDDRAALEARITDLHDNHPDWALAGNAGGIAPGELALRITDPHGENQSVGAFPQRVSSLDENFIVVRRAAQIGFSRNLTGFHFYGADICLAAETMGWQAYVIDFHLHHLSPGNKNASFDIAKAAFRTKWSHAFRPRYVQTTCALIRLDASRLGRVVNPAIEWTLEKLTRRLAWARTALARKAEPKPAAPHPLTQTTA